MKNQTLNDLYKIARDENKPLLFDANIVDTFPYLQEYVDNFADFDRQISRVNGYLEPLYNGDDEDTAQAILDAFRADCRSVVRRYNYNLKKLFDLIAIEYNPLHNYDRHEEFDDTTHEAGLQIDNFDKVSVTDELGAQKVSTTHGAMSIDNNVGERSDSTQYGESTLTSNFGEKQDTMVYGETNSENKADVYGDNSSDPADYNLNIQSTDSHTDTQTEGARIDSQTQASHTDVNTSQAYTDSTDISEYDNVTNTDAVTNTTETASREDSHDNSKDVTYKHIADITGNIGVMSSQQMYEAEWSIIKDKNPYDVLLYFISKDLLTFHDDGYDPLLTPEQNLWF